MVHGKCMVIIKLKDKIKSRKTVFKKEDDVRAPVPVFLGCFSGDHER